MLRQLVCGFVCLALFAGFATAADKGKKATGTFASYKEGTLTIKTKGDTKSQEFKVAADVKVTTYAGDDKKEGTAKDAFKDVKEGTPIIVSSDADGKVTAVQIGVPKKKEGK